MPVTGYRNRNRLTGTSLVVVLTVDGEVIICVMGNPRAGVKKHKGCHQLYVINIIVYIIVLFPAISDQYIGIEFDHLEQSRIHLLCSLNPIFVEYPSII